MNRDLERRIKILEAALAKELDGQREIRIVWKKAPTTAGGLNCPNVQPIPDSFGIADLPMPPDETVEDST